MAHIASISPDSPRYPDWVATFGGPTVPVRCPLPHRGFKPDGTHGRFYHVDGARLDPARRRALINHIARRWGIDPATVENQMDAEHGIPILADGVYVRVDLRLLL